MKGSIDVCGEFVLPKREILRFLLSAADTAESPRIGSVLSEVPRCGTPPYPKVRSDDEEGGMRA